MQPVIVVPEVVTLDRFHCSMGLVCNGTVTEVFLCIWILLIHTDCCSLLSIMIILPNLGFIPAQFSFITAQMGSDTPIF